jgi:hypothetical protein
MNKSRAVAEEPEIILQLPDSARGKPPQAANFSRSRMALLGFFAVVMLAIGIRLFFVQRLVPGGLYDDGYITLRYAANLAQGRGFVYNEGQPVWGTTTPLFTLVLSMAGRLFGVDALEMSAVLLGIGASVLFWCFLAATFEGQKVPRSISVPILLLVMFYPPYFENSLSGMETPLVLALMAASLLSYIKDRPYLLGILAAVLLLARIDTLIWIGILGLAFLIRHYHTDRPAILKALAAFVVAALPWHIYAFLTFRSLIPQSLVGKAVSHDAFSHLDWSYFIHFYQVYFPVGRLGPFVWIGILLTFVLMAAGLRDLWIDFPLLRPVGVFFFCFAAVFFCSKTPLYMWYFPPTQWIALLLACFGVRSVWDKWLARNASLALRAIPYGVLALFIAARSAWADSQIVQSRSALGPWAQIGDDIRVHTRQNAKVFLEHIGIVGFRSKRPILDNMGLVSPEIIELKRESPDDYEWLRKALLKDPVPPDVVVLYEDQDPIKGTGDWGSMKNWFASNYDYHRTVGGDSAGDEESRKAFVYFRKGAYVP